jgi:hypothetical protein
MMMNLRNYCLFGLILWLFCPVQGFAQAPNGFHYVRTDEDPSSVVYDSVHQQFFIAVPGKNEIDVVRDSSPAIVSKINIISPYGLDLSPDCSQLYVSSNSPVLNEPAAEGFFVVDTTTLHVVDFVNPTVPVNPIQIIFPNVFTAPQSMAAMSNGKIFYTADAPGLIGDGVIFAYDPATGISTSRPPAGSSGSSAIRKSANAQMFVVLSDGDLWTYDSTSDTYNSHLSVNGLGVSDAILNSDGTRILASGHLLFDQNLNLIADLNSTAGSLNYRGSAFSPDGTKIYVANSYDFSQVVGSGTTSFSSPVVFVYQTSSGALLGYVAAPQFLTNPFNRGIAVNSNGLAVLLNDRGFAELDLSHPNASLPGAVSQTLNYPRVLTPSVGSASNPSTTAVSGTGFRAGANVYFGSTPSSSVAVASANSINALPPAGLPGPVDVSVSFPDGWALYAPEAYSYGPTILYQDVNAGDAGGGTTVQLIGYGFDSSNGQPQITVGGSSATVTNVNLFTQISPFTFPIESLTFTTPSGAAGLADITVTTSYGSTTVKGGFRYLTQNLISGLSPAQMVLDESRGRLYVADFGSGDVKNIDINTLAVTTLMSIPGNASTGLAMTPDASKLLVISAGGGTLTVFDLNGGSVLKTFYPTPGNLPSGLIPNSIAATSRGTALVGLADPALLDSGDFYEVDLTTENATTFYMGLGCEVTSRMLLAPTLDGSTVYIANDGTPEPGFPPPSGGCLNVWRAALDSPVENRNYPNGHFQISTTSLGDRVLVDGSSYTPSLSATTAIAAENLLALERSLVQGEKIQSTGSLEYIPTTKGIEIYDIHHGQMPLSIGIPGGAAPTLDALTVNQAGDSLYVAEASGIGVIHLAPAPLSIGSLVPAEGSASGGNVVTVLGSGFASGATISLDGQSVPAQVIDSTHLTFVTPLVSQAKVSISVTNPNGDSYSLDAAYDASVHAPVPTSTLTQLSPLIVQTSNPVNLTITGSGFVAGSQVMMNGQSVQTVYLSSQQIVAYLESAQGPGPQSITVVNPYLGGASNTLLLQVNDPSPGILSLSPPSVAAGSPAFELKVGGNDSFSADSIVLWNGSARTTQYVNTSNLIAEISAADVSAQGTANVMVRTPSAVAPTSTPFPFTITSQSIASVQPSSFTFSPQLRGTKSVSFPVTLTSTGSISLVVNSISLSDAADFSETNNCPPSLPAEQSCEIQVSFAPTASTPIGLVSSMLTISDNTSTNPEIVKVFGFATDFQLQSNSASVSVIAGQSTSVALSLAGLGQGVSDQFQFSCSGLPTGASCLFNPTSIVPGSGPNPVNLTISTTGKASATLFCIRRFFGQGFPACYS